MKPIYYSFLIFLAIACKPGGSVEETVVETTESAPEQQSNNIRNHLVRVAAELTDNSLEGVTSADQLEQDRPANYKIFSEMISLTDMPLEGDRPPLNVKITGTIQKEGYRIEKLYYESMPGLYVPANLYIPDNITSPGAAIVYLCGHSHTQKVHYQPHPRKFAQLGFVCLIVETIQYGEVKGEHWGNYARGWFNWYSRGYTPAGVEVWNAMRGYDLLAEREDVDPEKIGVTGISGGGAIAWFTGAADPRFKAVAPVCGNSTVKSHITTRTIDGHCDCMMHINGGQWDFQNIGTLIAPRPLLIAQADRDGLNAVESVQEVYNDLRGIYDMYERPDNLSLVITPGGHSYHQKSREAIFSFFTEHLKGEKIPGEQLGDVDGSPEVQLSVEELAVYTDGPPPGDLTTTIQDHFVKIPAAPELGSIEDLISHRGKTIDFLMKNTFSAFPKEAPPLDTVREFRTLDDAKYGMEVYSFVPEKDWRLKVEVQYINPKEEKKPLMLVLRSPGERRWASESFVSGLSDQWNKAYFEVRGVGETGWSSELEWHVRRAAAWTGRTVASMRTYDVLRCLEFVRSLRSVDGERVSIAAQGEMAVVAMYAALLDGNIEMLVLKDPPATQDLSSSEDGRGMAIEMLHALRATDLNQLPALVSPTKTVFVGAYPDSYGWSAKTLEALGQKGLVRVVESLNDLE